jgi:hypothetical protein
MSEMTKVRRQRRALQSLEEHSQCHGEDGVHTCDADPVM